MSDVMLLGVLRMPMDNAGPLDVFQYVARGRQAADRIEADAKEIERLRGITPELPPRPPDGEGLQRYGLRHNGPKLPMSVPMDDGYWVPWHLAHKEIERLQQLVIDAAYTLEKARIWGGMGWHYNPLHPIHYTPMRERLQAECARINDERARKADSGTAN